MAKPTVHVPVEQLSESNRREDAAFSSYAKVAIANGGRLIFAVSVRNAGEPNVYSSMHATHQLDPAHTIEAIGRSAAAIVLLPFLEGTRQAPETRQAFALALDSAVAFALENFGMEADELNQRVRAAYRLPDGERKN